ncbi:MAG: single-stranded DNA-binding protein [Caulobacterales bacterium 68-7]|nr:single-stranded DNA-binding protein [Caulobacterales bacterium]OJU11790.1 MAG: single-stranded DNA-binding protein [Caulobacterales bacterium 68-7]
MQTVTVEGFLAADPSILTAQGSGRRRASFRVLETARFRRGDGQRGERTTGFNCICFNEQTTDAYIAPYAKKGARVVVSGHVENDTWTGRDGTIHYDLRLVVDGLRIKARRAKEDDVDESEPEAPLAPTFDLDDEIPF